MKRNSGFRGAIDRRWWLLIAFGWALFVLLGSWFPFHYQPGTPSDAWSAWWTAGTWGNLSAADVAINLLLGIPLGFLGLLVWLGGPAPSRIWHRVAGAVLVVLLVASWGMLVELGQYWFGNRVPSCVDTLAQTLGGVFGAVVCWWGGEWFAERTATALGRRRQRSLLDAWLDLYVAGYGFWMLMPFLPVLSPSELKSKLQAGAIQFSPLSEWSSAPWQAAYTALVASVTAVPVGWWFARWLGAWQNRLHLATAVLAAVLCVVALEAAQTFIETRVVAANDAFWSAIGAAVGVAVVGGRASSDRPTIHRTLTAAPAFAIGSILYALVYALFAWAPFDWIESSDELQRRLQQLRTQGWERMLAGNDMYRASNLLSTIFWSAPLGALAALAAMRSRTFSRLAWILAVGWVGIVCVSTELGQLVFRSRSPGVLELSVRIAGGIIGIVLAWQVVRRLRRGKDELAVIGRR